MIRLTAIIRGIFMTLLVLLPPLASPGINLPIVGTQIQVSSSERYDILGADIDPRNSRYMIVCGEYYVPADNAIFGYVYTTADSGRTWHRTLVDRSSEWVSEESCAYGSNGVAYFTAGESKVYYGQEHHEQGLLRIYRSADHGETWVSLGTHPFIDYTSDAVDRTHSGPHRGTLYIFGNASATTQGQWWGKRLTNGQFIDYKGVLDTVKNGGPSISGPVRLHPTGYQSDYFFANGATVLSNGTAIAVGRTTHDPIGSSVLHMFLYPSHNVLDVLASTDGGKTLQFRATVSGIGSHDVASSSIIQDTSNDRYHGRLYLAWGDFRSSNATIFLATSNDAGFHWISHRIIEGRTGTYRYNCTTNKGTPTLYPPELAISRNGTLGLSWAENSGAIMRFALSDDGGKNFTANVRIAECSSVRSKEFLGNFLAAYPWEDHAAAAYKNRSDLSNNVSKLGISLDVDPQGSASPRLLTDASGAFHAIWSEPATGILQTATIQANTKTIASAKPAEVTSVRSASMPSIAQLSGLPKILNPSELRSHSISNCQATSLANLQDITSSVAFEFSNLKYYPKVHTFTVGVRLINRGQRLIKNPMPQEDMPKRLSLTSILPPGNQWRLLIRKSVAATSNAAPIPICTYSRGRRATRPAPTQAPATDAEISEIRVIGSTPRMLIKIKASTNVGKVCPTLSVPGIRSSGTSRKNLKHDVVGANEPIPSVSKKFVTNPITNSIGRGHTNPCRL